MNTEIRGRIIELEAGLARQGPHGEPMRWSYAFGIDLDDKPYLWFTSHGFAGNGETWYAVIVGLVLLHAPQLSDSLDFDPEGGGIAVWSTHEASLRVVADLVTRAWEDEAMLAAAVEAAQKRGVFVE
jgi:hypothetical protein